MLAEVANGLTFKSPKQSPARCDVRHGELCMRPRAPHDRLSRALEMILRKHIIA